MRALLLQNEKKYKLTGGVSCAVVLSAARVKLAQADYKKQRWI
jgi:hypothetical protein